MKRRDFCTKTGCGVASLMAGPLVFGSSASAGQSKQVRYKIDIEIYEAREDSWCHKKGEKFAYPQDIGKICPWLLASMHDFIRILETGGLLPWKYENTPYEKVIDPDGITTEFVRCPDPTADFVAKITRTKVG